jgi:hypothetical protein
LLYLSKRARDIRGGKALCGQLGGIDLDANFALHAANSLEPANAGDPQDGLGHFIVNEPRQILFIVASRSDFVDQHGVGVDADGAYRGLLQVRRQI